MAELAEEQKIMNKSMKPCFVYVLSSQSRKYIYIGTSFNQKQRIAFHQNGLNKTTRAYIPFRIIFIEEFSNRKEAREREKT